MHSLELFRIKQLNYLYTTVAKRFGLSTALATEIFRQTIAGDGFSWLVVGYVEAVRSSIRKPGYGNRD